MKMLCSTSALFITATLVAGCGTQPRSGGSVETAGSVPTPVVDSTSKSGNGRYSSVNGLNMYYEVHGSGPPLVLLHGAFTTIDSAWAKLLPSLAKSRQVIAIEQQGHGHTADIDRPITYEQMAEDTAALLRELKIEQADVMGWSMGGTIALRLAMRHPGLVRKLVVIAGHYNNQGWDPAQFEAFKNLPADFAPKELKEPYGQSGTESEPVARCGCQVQENCSGVSGLAN